MSDEPSKSLPVASDAEAAAASAAEDQDLVRRCRSGEREAFDALVTKYRQRVFAMTYGICRNEEDAWDLAQEAFLRVWKALPRFRGESAFFTWFYRIIRNVGIDWVRSHRHESGVEFDDAMGLQHVEAGARTMPAKMESPDAGMRGREVRERINEAMQKLSPEHREVILLRELEGMEYLEIAEKTGEALGTVMSRLFYARKKLQTLLRDVYEEL